MRLRLRSGLFSLQTKLVLAMTALIVLGVLATGTVFVLRSKQERREQALERVAAAAPLFYQSGSLTGEAGPMVGPPGFQVERFAPGLDQLATTRDVRVLLVGDQGVVLHDTSGGLQGITLSYPAAQPADLKRGFMTWQPGVATGAGLTLVAPAEAIFGSRTSVPAGSSGSIVPPAEGIPALPPPPDAGAPFSMTLPQPGGFRVVLAVDSDTIEDAWLSALPGVGIAGALAMPFAILAAVFLARQIARPVYELTLASEAMARGDFDQRVEVGRDDEVGRLAKAFSRMAERVGERDSQMRDLVANVSHDLKTPMTSILGYAQALKDGFVATEDIARIAGIVQAQAEQTSLLLDDLLFLSEIDAGQVLRGSEDIEVAQLLERACERVRTAADQKGVALEFVATPGITTQIDVQRTVRAFANVIENAIKYSSANQPVHVTAREAGSRVLVEVANTGPRIPDDDLPHIFERFYRGAASQPGHGLGLAIAHETFSMNGGSISVQNQEQGVLCRIDLPAWSDDAGHV